MDTLLPEVAVEEQLSHPLFTARRPHQCAWPLWRGDEPLTLKRCCGARVRLGSKIPYCAEHLETQLSHPTQRSA